MSCDWQQRGHESRLRWKCAHFFTPAGQKEGMMKGAVYLWEANIDTTRAQKMTGLRRGGVVQGEARLSTWQLCNSNTVQSLKALGHCHRSCYDPRWRCFAVSWHRRNVAAIAVYTLGFKTHCYREVLQLRAEEKLLRWCCRKRVHWLQAMTSMSQQSQGNYTAGRCVWREQGAHKSEPDYKPWHQEHKVWRTTQGVCSDWKVWKRNPI